MHRNEQTAPSPDGSFSASNKMSYYQHWNHFIGNIGKTTLREGGVAYGLSSECRYKYTIPS